MTELIVTPSVNSSPILSVTDEATRLKGELLGKALPILAIPNETARDYAITIAGNIKAHLKEVEASRIEVKKPFLQTSQAIDGVAREHVLQLGLELQRINGLVGQFEADRRRALEALRQAMADEEKRLAELADPDKNCAPANLAATLEAEDRLQAAQDKLTAVQVAAEAQKPTGGALRKDWDIEILDLKALYAAHPQCVTMTPSIMAIKDLLKIDIIPAGVRATPKAAYNARAATPQLR